MAPSYFLQGKFGIRRLHVLIVVIFLVSIAYIDLRPATTSLGPSSAQNFKALNCEAGCYAFGSHALRVLIDGRGVMRIVFFDAKALTAFTAFPSLLALALVDYFSAGMFASVYITAVIQARASAPKPQLAIKDIPVNTKCIIIGVNDYVESYGMRRNHSCGYINYVDERAPTTGKNNLKERIFAQAVERYGDLYDLLFLDRDAEVDTGMAISSVPKWAMAMGQKNEEGDGTYKLQSRVLVSRLGDAPDFYEKIDGLRQWAIRQDSSDVSDKPKLKEVFVKSKPSALGRRCTSQYFNTGDCMRNRADSIFTIRWNAMVVYAAFVVGMYAIYTWMLLQRVNDATGLYVQIAIGGSCMFFAALLIGAIGQSPESWAAWYSGREIYMSRMSSWSLQSQEVLGWPVRPSTKDTNNRSDRIFIL